MCLEGMADDLLESYNPLYDVHLKSYFAAPHMQKHLRSLGLLEGGGGKGEVYARHKQMIDIMLKNREQQLAKLADLQKKLDAAEKVEIYRRIRSGQSPETYRRSAKPSRSLSRGRRSASNSARVRRSSSTEGTDVVADVESHKDDDQSNFTPRNCYARLSANTGKYRYLHKLDDSTLLSYKDQLRRQLDKLERFREVTFGVHSVARHQPAAHESWFFRRRSLPSLAASAPAHTLQEPLRSITNMRGRKATPNSRALGESYSSRVSCPPAIRKRRNSTESNARLPPVNNSQRPPKTSPATGKPQHVPKLPPVAPKRGGGAARGRSGSRGPVRVSPEKLPPIGIAAAAAVTTAAVAATAISPKESEDDDRSRGYQSASPEPDHKKAEETEEDEGEEHARGRRSADDNKTPSPPPAEKSPTPEPAEEDEHATQATPVQAESPVEEHSPSPKEASPEPREASPEAHEPSPPPHESSPPASPEAADEEVEDVIEVAHEHSVNASPTPGVHDEAAASPVQHSPEAPAESPAPQAASPEQPSPQPPHDSPAPKEASPEPAHESPVHKEASPEPVHESPREASPEAKEASSEPPREDSPEAKDPSPEPVHESPMEKHVVEPTEAAPKSPSPQPKEASPPPKEASPSPPPAEASPPPKEPTPSPPPAEASPAPKEPSPSPPPSKETSPSPPPKDASPKEATPSPPPVEKKSPSPPPKEASPSHPPKEASPSPPPKEASPEPVEHKEATPEPVEEHKEPTPDLVEEHKEATPEPIAASPAKAEIMEVHPASPPASPKESPVAAEHHEETTQEHIEEHTIEKREASPIADREEKLTPPLIVESLVETARPEDEEEEADPMTTSVYEQDDDDNGSVDIDPVAKTPSPEPLGDVVERTETPGEKREETPSGKEDDENKSPSPHNLTAGDGALKASAEELHYEMPGEKENGEEKEEKADSPMSVASDETDGMKDDEKEELTARAHEESPNNGNSPVERSDVSSPVVAAAAPVAEA